MLTNPHLGEGELAPNEPARFDQIPAETHQAVAEMAERAVRGRDLRPWTFESKPVNQLDWFEQLLGDPR